MKDAIAQIREPVDRWLGTSATAVVVRTTGALLLIGLALWVRDRKDLLSDLLWASAWAVGLIVVPALKDLERVFGARTTNLLLGLVVFGLPLTIAGLFTALTLMPNDGSFKNAEAYWTLKAIVGAVALAAWIGFALIVRKMFQKGENAATD